MTKQEMIAKLASAMTTARCYEQGASIALEIIQQTHHLVEKDKVEVVDKSLDLGFDSSNLVSINSSGLEGEFKLGLVFNKKPEINKAWIVRIICFLMLDANLESIGYLRIALAKASFFF